NLTLVSLNELRPSCKRQVQTRFRRSSDERRPLGPVVAAARALEAVVVEVAHVFRVERLRQHFIEVAAYEGEVVVDAVALGGVVDADHVVQARGGDHGRDGAAGDAQRLALDDGVFRIKPAVADDVSARLDYRLAGAAALGAVAGELRGVEERLGEGAAV